MREPAMPVCVTSTNSWDNPAKGVDRSSLFAEEDIPPEKFSKPERAVRLGCTERPQWFDPSRSVPMPCTAMLGGKRTFIGIGSR
jgi:hypothetical protein